MLTKSFFGQVVGVTYQQVWMSWMGHRQQSAGWVQCEQPTAWTAVPGPHCWRVPSPLFSPGAHLTGKSPDPRRHSDCCCCPSHWSHSTESRPQRRKQERCQHLQIKDTEGYSKVRITDIMKCKHTLFQLNFLQCGLKLKGFIFSNNNAICLSGPSGTDITFVQPTACVLGGATCLFD